MDHSGTWPAYSQHYPCLSGGVNTASNPLPQPSQLNDLSLSSSIPRQESVAGYGGAGPSLLLPVHHGLNVSQGGSHSETNFVNSPNLLSTTYDSMLSTFPPPAKGHLGALNLPPSSALFKTISKESEINELRGGFSRRAGLPPGAIPADSNVGISGGSAAASPGLFNAQTSPHSWRSSEIVPTSSSPFGVLPHKSVMQRTNSETPSNKALSQVAKSPRNIIETNRFNESDINFRNVLDSSPNTSRPPLMMTQSEGLPTTPDNLSLTAMKPDFVAFHNNGSAINNPRSTLLDQNYITHGQFSSIDMHNEKRGGFSSESVSSTCKSNAFNSAAKNSIPCTDMFGNSLSSSTTNNAPLPAHNSTRNHNNSGTGGNAQLSPRNVGPPTSTSSQSQPRDLSSYSAYSATPTIPTNSQSFLANQMPSPSSLSVNHGMNFSATGNQQSGPQPNNHEPHGHFAAIASKPPTAPTSVIVSDNEVTNVAYPSVITRANMSSQVNTGYSEPMMLTLVKNMDDSKSVHSSSDHLAHSLPVDSSLKLHDVPYDHMVKSNSSVNSDSCMTDINQNTSIVTDIPTNLSCSSSKQMLPGNIASQMLSPEASSPLEIGSNDQRSLTPKNLVVESMFGGQGMPYQHTEGIPENSKMNVSSGNAILMHSRHSPEMSDSNPRSISGSRHEMKRRRRSKRRRYYHHSRAESPPDMMVQITPMTPVSANKLSHKMAPLPHSVPLHHHPPVSSPLVPIDLSSNDMMEPLHHLQCVGNMSQMNVTSPLDIVHNGTSNNCNNDINSINSVESVLTPLPNVSPREINHLSPPQLPATPVHTPATNCTSTTSLDNSPRPKKSVPSIEDDLGFLAELPPVCNITIQQNKRVPYKGETKNSYKMNPSNGGFLESFMKFVKGDIPPPLNSPLQRRRGRGRGRVSSAEFSSRMDILSRAGSNGLELNPSTGLFVTRETPTPPEGKDSLEKSSENAILDVNDDMKLMKDSIKGKTAEKITQEIIVPNPEAPKFSSDEEFSPLSLDAVNKSTIHGLSDMENSSSKLDMKEKPNAVVKTDVSPVEKIENRHELKIKVIGLRSGNLQTAQKARFCHQQRRRRRQRSSSKNSGLSSPKYENSDVSDEEFDIDEMLIDRNESNHVLEKRSAQKFPPRQLSMRKCKEKVIQKRQEKIEKRRQQIAVDITNADDINDILDSDSDKDSSLYNSDTDPAWTPIRRDGTKPNRLPSIDDDGRQKQGYRPRKRQKFARRRRTRNKRTRSEGDWSIMQRNLVNATVPTYNECSVRIDEPVPQLEDPKETVEEEEQEEKKVGDFVIAKSDLMKDIHPIWRIDRQNLLQKFEPFIKEGQTLYKKTSTFAGWVASNRSQYQGIDVNILVEELNTVIVECIQSHPVLEQTSVPPTVEIKPQMEVLDLNHQKESFEVYIQTLISQALDPNFIPEIIKEQDEYFLSNIREIDLVVTKCKNSILNLADWTENLRHCIECFPDLNLTSEDDDFLGVESNCQACSLKPCMQKMTFSGQPYNSVTLLYQKDLLDIKEKEFHVCSGCSEIILLYNQIYHQKFRLYMLCSSKVKDIQQMDQNKESHVILEFCLEDAAWINKLFDDTLNIWRKCLRYRR